MPIQSTTPFCLGIAAKGFSGSVKAISVTDTASSLSAAEIERRLLELGFIEGAQVKILHDGQFGRYPIAERLNGSTVALRRREAMAIQLSFEDTKDQ